MTSFIETLNHWGDQFLNFAWPMLWQSSLLIAIIFVLDLALRRKIRAAIRYALWLMVLVKLLLPPSLALPTSLTWWLLPSPQSPAKPQTTAYVVTYGDQTAPVFPLQSQPAPAPIQPKMSFAAWSLAASGAVSAGLLAWLMVRWLQINQKVRRAKTSEKLIPVLDEAQRLTCLRPGIRLKLTEDSMSPAVCGLFRPVILLPQSLVEKLSAGQLRAVLLHEAIHLRRGDVWVNCAQALLQIFYWWHPLLWLANARIRRVREEAVDDAVMLALRDDAEIYAPTLLEVAKVAFNRPLACLGLVGILESRSALRQRIERLINFRPPRRAGLTLVSILGILAFTAAALPMGEAPEKTNEPTVSLGNDLPISTNAFKGVFQTNTSINTVTGILNDPKFRVELHALEQRTGVESLAEPEPVTTAGQGANQINRIVVPDKINIPAITTNAVESGKLVQDGKLLYEMGKFDDAEAKLKAALVLNPDNQAAHYYLDLVAQSRWAPKSQGPKVFYPAWNDNRTNSGDIHTSPAREVISKKLNSIRIESVPWFGGITLNEAIRFVAQQSKLRDPDKTGVNFVYVPSAEPGMNAAATPTHLNPATGRLEATPANATDPSTINVKLVTKDVSLHDLLDAIVRGADKPVKYSIEDYGVIFSQNDSTTPQLEMRVFRADSQFFVSNLIMTPGVQSTNIATMAESLFSKRGVDLTAPGRSIAYNDKLGLLFVRATASEMDTVERAIVALSQLNPQIHVKARFIEVPKKGFVAMPQLFSNAVAGQVTGILSDSQFRTLLQALEHRQGVETLAEPECVTTSGRQVQMRATDTMNVTNNFPPQGNSGNSTAAVPQVEKIEIGPVVDVVPYVLSDGYTVNLKVTTQVLTFLGYEEVPAVPAPIAPDKLAPKKTTLPHFRAQNNDTIVNLWDGQTVVLGSTNLQNFVFVTATIVDPAGNRVHSDDELRQIQEKTKSEIPPQPKFPSPSP